VLRRGRFFWEGGWLFAVGESLDKEEKGEEEGEIGEDKVE